MHNIGSVSIKCILIVCMNSLKFSIFLKGSNALLIHPFLLKMVNLLEQRQTCQCHFFVPIEKGCDFPTWTKWWRGKLIPAVTDNPVIYFQAPSYLYFYVYIFIFTIIMFIFVYVQGKPCSYHTIIIFISVWFLAHILEYLLKVKETWCSRWRNVEVLDVFFNESAPPTFHKRLGVTVSCLTVSEQGMKLQTCVFDCVIYLRENHHCHFVIDMWVL